MKEKLDKISRIKDTLLGKHKVGSLEIEIVKTNILENGIEIFARAWKDGKSLGFGDGTVEIERFRIFNPPLLARTGIRENFIDDRGENKDRDTFIENPKLAILQTLEHTIKVSCKEDGKITKGKIGNTTDTFYPNNATAVNGLVTNDVGVLADTWANVRGASTGTTAQTNGADGIACQLRTGDPDNTWRVITRSFFLFDTSALPDTDTIDSATISLYGEVVTTNANIPTQSIVPVASTPASDTTITTADFDQLGNTAFSTGIAFTSFSTSAYNDFALNASGLSAISKTGISKFGFRTVSDQSNTEPSVSIWNEDTTRIIVWLVDWEGTANDPKLVVVHEASSNIKTYNTNAKANIKTINTNAIANVKTLNTNA